MLARNLKKGSLVMPSKPASKPPRNFDSAPGFSDEARQAVNAAFDATYGGGREPASHIDGRAGRMVFLTQSFRALPSSLTKLISVNASSEHCNREQD
jgi:hypothetical protein